MKKKITIIICIYFLVSGVVTFAMQTLQAEEVNFKIFIEDSKQEFKNPIITVDNNTYVPLRELSELLGMQVKWDEKSSSIYLQNTDNYHNLHPFEDENYMWGYKDNDGNIVIEPIYYWAEDFNDGLALVSKSGGQNTMSGFIDETGKEIIECKYYEAYSFSDGVALVRLATHTDQGLFTFIDKKGEFIFDKTFDIANSFHEGYAVVIKGSFNNKMRDQNKWTYINKTGEYASELEFDEAYDFNNGYAKVVLNGQSGTIDKDFNFVPD